MPGLALDRPGIGSRLGRTFIASGWALDLAAPTGTGADAVHLWAFPTGGGTGIFLGAATYGTSRPDVGAAFGSRFTNSGFQLTASGVPPGNYTISAYMRSTYTGTFNAVQSATNVTILNNFTVGSIDNPKAGSSLQRPFGISGWAADTGATFGTGIDPIHIWAFPTRGGSPVFLGAASYGASRPDVSSYLGSSQFKNSGWSLLVNSSNLPAPGTYDFHAYGRSTVTGSFSEIGILRVRVSSPQGYIDNPGAGSSQTRPFGMLGWAADTGATSGTGIDAIHVWAYPHSGAPPLFVGAASYGASRPDVGSFLRSSQFNNSGWNILLNSSNLPVAGAYDLYVYARSTLTGTFSVIGTVRLTVS